MRRCTQETAVCPNAAARLITNTRNIDHITLVLRDLHWHTVRQRVVFKTQHAGLQVSRPLSRIF